MRIGRANGRLVIIDGDGVIDAATVSGGENQAATWLFTHPAQPEVLVVRRHRADVRDTQGH